MEDEDMHMCLVCQTTIHGLLNYVQHKKSQCSGRKDAKVVPKEHSSYSTVSNVTDIQNISIAGNASSYLTSGYHANSQQFPGTSVGNMSSLSTTAAINNDLDLFDPSQFQVAVTESVGQLSDINSFGMKVSSVSCQSLFDQQNISISSQARLEIASSLSTLQLGTMFPQSSQEDEGASKEFGRYNAQEDHGILSTCLKPKIDGKDITNYNNSNNAQMSSSFQIATSEASHNDINEINSINDDKDLESENNKTASEKVDDFFLSLELMSKNDPRAEKGSNFNQPLLPITNILNNLTFSSDEDDLGFDFTEDVSFDSLTDDSGDESAPPQNHTGGKWRPGEAPAIVRRNRPVFRGKWPPGQAPAQTAHKYYGTRSKGGKQIKLPPPSNQQNRRGRGRPARAKSFQCNFCDVSYISQITYSHHCRSQEHREKVFGKQEEPRYRRGKGKSFKYISDETKKMVIDEDIEDHLPDSEGHDAVTHEKPAQKIINETHNVSGLNPILKNEIGESHVMALATESEADTVDTHADNLDSAKSSTGAGEPLDKGTTDSINNIALKQEVKEDEKKTVDEAGENNMSATPLEMFRCTICCKHFNNRYKVARHLLTKDHRSQAKQHPEDSFALLTTYHKYLVRLSPFQCEICRFYFINNRDFEDHLESDRHMSSCSDLIGEMMCSICKYKSHTHSCMIEHLKSDEHVKHVAKRSRICVFKESHAKCHCKYCGLEMISFTRLKRHVQFKHANKEVVMNVRKKKHGVRNKALCYLCQREFQSESAFLLHYRRAHSGDKPHKCETCNVSFAGKHALSIHCNTRKHIQNMAGVIPNKSKRTFSIIKRAIQQSMVGTKTPQILESVDRGKNNATGTGSDFIADSENVTSANSTDSRGDAIKTKEKRNITTEDNKDSDDDLPNQSEEEIMDDDKEWVPETLSERKKLRIKRSKSSKSKVKSTKAKEQKPSAAKQKKRKVSDKTNTRPYKCDHCDYIVATYNELRPHYMKEHSTQIKPCEICDIVFLSQKALRIHEQSKEHQDNIARTGANTDTRYYQCHICGKKYTDEKFCNFHTAYHHFHATTEEAMLRENNGKDVTREKYKLVLAAVDKLDQQEQYKCPDCPSVLKKKNFLEHLRIHTGDKPFKCKICPRGFVSSITLRRHLIGHFGWQERTCEECGKFFKKSCSYEEHMQLHAAEKSKTEKSHKCSICGQCFFFEGQLAKHAIRHRKKEFVCTFPGCHWKFVFANELKYHMTSHSQLRPFLCDICGYSAATKCRLKRHHLTHTGERKYHCEYCTYKAGNSTHLRRHMRIHIGSKPYKCPYCDYTCNTHENIRKHIIHTKKHAGLPIYPCAFCEYGTNICNEFRAHLLENHEDKIGPDFRPDNVSAFSGLYSKTDDPRQPIEGTKIIQLKERVSRAESNTNQVVTKQKSARGGAQKKNTKLNNSIDATTTLKNKYSKRRQPQKLDLSDMKLDVTDVKFTCPPVPSTALSDKKPEFSKNNTTVSTKLNHLYRHPMNAMDGQEISTKMGKEALLPVNESSGKHSIQGLFHEANIHVSTPDVKMNNFPSTVMSQNHGQNEQSELFSFTQPPVPRKLVLNNNLHSVQPPYTCSVLDPDLLRKHGNNGDHTFNFQSSIAGNRTEGGGAVPVSTFSSDQGQTNASLPGRVLSRSVRDVAFLYHDYCMRDVRDDGREQGNSNLMIDAEYHISQC